MAIQNTRRGVDWEYLFGGLAQVFVGLMFAGAFLLGIVLLVSGSHDVDNPLEAMRHYLVFIGFMSLCGVASLVRIAWILGDLLDEHRYRSPGSATTPDRPRG